VANTAGNSKSKSGKGKPTGKSTGKQAQGQKAVAKRADAKPARGKSQQKPQQKAKANRPAEKKGLMKFLRDVRIEMGKVTWPTRKDLIQSTIVVLVAVAIATAYTGVLDFVFSKVVDTVVNVLT
jgi:preprotein translocase subunit SecE